MLTRRLDLKAAPAAVMVVGLGVGIALAGRRGLPPDALAPPTVETACWGALMLVGLALALADWWPSRLHAPRGAVRAIGMGLTFCGLGGLLLCAALTPPSSHVARLVGPPPSDPVERDAWLGGREVEATGRVASSVRVGDRSARFTLDEVEVGAKRWRGTIAVTIVPSNWRADFAPPDLEQGQRVRLSGELRPPPPKGNPSDFGYGAFLVGKGTWATMRVKAPTNPGESASDLVVLGDERGVLDRVVGAVRSHVEAALARFVPHDEPRALLRALLLGERHAISGETREQFARTGLLHLLAVSGLHVLLVGMLLHGLLRPFLLRMGLRFRAMEIGRALVTIAILCVYALVTGGSDSVWRAVLMATLAVAGRAFQKPSAGTNALAIAALVLLILRPTRLFGVGFQLSFLAVLGLLTLGRTINDVRPKRVYDSAALSWLWNATAATVAATVATAPVLLFHFGRVPLAGLVLNLPAVPLTLMAFASALLTVGLAWIPPVAGALGASADVLCRLLIWTTQTGEQALGRWALEGFVTRPLLVAALTASVLLVMGWRYRAVRAPLAGSALLLAAVSVWASVLSPQARRPSLDVLFFDIGQGDAALLRTPSGRHILIDAGPLTDTWDAGERTILPHLQRLGIDRLDAVVISHPHADHLGGLPSLLRNVEVGRVVDNGQRASSILYAETHFLLDSLGVARRSVSAGDTLGLGDGIVATVLGPVRSNQPEDEANNASVVLLIRYGDVELLFAGDAEREAEAEMLHRWSPLIGEGLLRADIVKVGHHGSRTSSTAGWIDAVLEPGGIAVVSVARQNIYRLPNAEVLDRWTNAAADVRLTHRGALWLRTDGQSVERIDW